MRKDENGCGIIERVWNHRNTASPANMKNRSDKTNCPTYGLCNDQSNGDEQGAVDKVLWGDVPHLVGSHVTRITPRDTSSKTRADIAFNTVHRGGCAQSFKNGKLSSPWDISKSDLANNKEGIWKKGDWIGQTAGFPLLGVYYPDQKLNCIKDPKRKIEPIRIFKVREMLAAVEA